MTDQVLTHGAIKDNPDPDFVWRLQFRRLLAELKITSTQWSELMSAYIVRYHPAATRAEQIAIRGDLSAELTQPYMTFEVFRKGLKLLNIEEANITDLILRVGENRFITLAGPIGLL